MQLGVEPNLIEIAGLLIGGLALFLFALELMTEALKAIAGSRLQALLGTLAANRFRGVLAGAGITALLNSSTITTVLLIGFVSAGLMTLQQSIPLVMGANIGSTLTAQIIAFNISAAAPFLLAGGFLMHSFAKSEVLREVGRALLGMGMLFLGIEFMGDATRPLRSYEPFISAMQNMRNPWLGIVAGAVFTAVVQSSAATLAIVITLGSQGLIPLEAGIALILGANVGTCGTALLASIGKASEAVQVALVHLIFNLLGVLFLVFVIPQFADFIRHISPSAPELTGAARSAAEMPRQAANAHTIFSVLSTTILIWFTGPIGRLAERLAPSTHNKWQSSSQPQYLDETLVHMPALAISRVQLELTVLGQQVLKQVQHSVGSVVENNRQDLATLVEEDKSIDALSTSILTYIGSLSEGVHTDEEGKQLVDLTRISTCLDSIREATISHVLARSQRRMSPGANNEHLRSNEISGFAATVMRQFELAVKAIVHPVPETVKSIVEAKLEIEAQAEIARRHTMSVLQLRNQADAVSYRFTSDMIEHLNEIARLSRAIAKACLSLNALPMTEPSKDQTRS